MGDITLKGNPHKTEGSFLEPGHLAPDFELVNNDLQSVTLEQYRGKKKIVAIVPSLDTPVCQTETKKLNEFAKVNPSIEVLVISCDLPFAQSRFCSLEQLENVTTLSVMRSNNFLKNYGVLIADGPLAGIAARAIIVLDEQDKVVYSELVAEVSDEPNYDDAFKSLFETD